MTATLPAPPLADDVHTDPLREALVDAVGGDYEVVRLLGRGGMGAVYLARDRALERLVAIKVLPPGANTDAAALERFRREARTVAALQHGGIVPLHAFGERRGLCWFVMGYVRGESLAARLEREGALDPDVARALLAQLADALDHAHRAGVVHRDIKPDNVLIDDTTGRALLTDFGIARAETARAVTALTQSGSVMGTPHYMSPEQATAEPLDGRSDLYSLGVVGYEMLAGRLPFDGGSFRELVLQHVSAAPRALAEVAPQVPVDLAEAVMRCLAKEPDARYADAGALRSALGGTSWDDEALAYELADIRHLVANWLVVLAIAAVVLLAAWTGGWEGSPFVGGVLGLPFAGFMIVAQVRQARARGYGWDVIRRVATLPPRWWVFPWPRPWRRTTDVYARLPRSLRAARWLTLAMAVSFLVFIPAFAHVKRLIDLDVRTLVPAVHATYALRPFGSLAVVGDLLVLIAIMCMMVLGTIGHTVLGALAGRRHGLGGLDWQRLATKPTDASFWRDARIKPVLVDTTAPAASEPSTPQELVTRILSLARTTTPSGAHAGADAGGAARRLLETITGIDRELESLGRTAPPEQLERVEAELVLLEHDGGDDEGLVLLRAQRDALARAAVRAATLAERRRDALGELEGLWRDVRRATDAPDPREAAQRLQARAEAIERAFPPRTRSTTRGTAAAMAAALATLLAATPSTAAAPATPAQRAAAALLDRGALDSAARAIDALATAGDDSPTRWRLAGRVALLEPTRRPLAVIPATMRALDAFGTAAARDSSDVFALEHLVWLHRLAPAVLGGREATGRRALARLDRIAPYRAALLRGYLASVDGVPGLAIARFRALVAAHPDSAPAWFGIADVAARASHADLAADAYARYRALAPADGTTDFHVGVLSARAGVRLADGEASLRRYLARPWRTGQPRHDVAWWRLGQVLEKAGRPAEARGAYAKALAIDPKDDDFRASMRALDAATAAPR